MKKEIESSGWLFWLGETNIFIATAAAAATAGTYGFYHLNPDYYMVGFVLLATCFTYNLQRRIGDIKSTGMYHRTKTLLLLISAGGLVALAFQLNWKELLGLSIAGILSIAYALPIIPWKGEKYSLRRIPHLKIWIILAVWLGGTAIVPLLDFHDLSSYDDKLSIILYLGQQATLILALTIPFDIRDLRIDDWHQRTLPMLLGREGALSIARRVLFVSCAFCFFNYLIGFSEYYQLIFHIVICLITLILVNQSRQPRHQNFYLINLDGIILLQGLGFSILYLL